MNLRYYLRGLGVGILVTAVIMEVAAGGRKEALSDAEIKERAAALGMVEERGTLSDLEADMQEKEPTAPITVPTKEPTAEPTAKPTAEPTTKPTIKPTAEPTAKPTVKPTAEPAKEVKTVSITVKAGDGSYTICQRLEDAGLIASASDFDRYLYENGYDKKLRTGNYEIPTDALPETIAEILIFGK